MALKATFRNPRTGESRKVKVGWSWVLFFFSTFFGLPLFRRGQNGLGAFFLGITLVGFLLPFLGHSRSERDAISLCWSVVLLGLSIWMGLKGNGMMARHYLDAGWEFVEPEADATRFAKLQWGLA